MEYDSLFRRLIAASISPHASDSDGNSGSTSVETDAKDEVFELANDRQSNASSQIEEDGEVIS